MAAWDYLEEFYPRLRDRRVFLRNVIHAENAQQLAKTLVREFYKGRFGKRKITHIKTLNALKCFISFKRQSLPTLRRNFYDEQFRFQLEREEARRKAKHR